VEPHTLETIYGACPYIRRIFVHADPLQDVLVAIIVPRERQLLQVR
jgi:long-subunit acyl-CoA synthetase (AMP-forming)